MGDTSGAEMGGDVFDLLARAHKRPDKFDPLKEARKFWKKMELIDCSPDEMDADKALLTLGLACKGVDPDYPEEGPIVLYKGDPGFKRKK